MAKYAEKQARKQAKKEARKEARRAKKEARKMAKQGYGYADPQHSAGYPRESHDVRLREADKLIADDLVAHGSGHDPHSGAAGKSYVVRPCEADVLTIRYLVEGYGHDPHSACKSCDVRPCKVVD